jgi:GNAT superfamily N-acetyltransferase
MLRARPSVPADIEAVVAIVRGLPEYFTADVPDKVQSEAAAGGTWVLSEPDSGGVAGFAITKRMNGAAAEIRWMAVAPGRRGQGLGTALLGDILSRLSADGVRVRRGQDPRQLGWLPALRSHARILGTQRVRPHRHDRPAAGMGAGQPRRHLRGGPPANALSKEPDHWRLSGWAGTIGASHGRQPTSGIQQLAGEPMTLAVIAVIIVGGVWLLNLTLFILDLVGVLNRGAAFRWQTAGLLITTAAMGISLLAGLRGRSGSSVFFPVVGVAGLALVMIGLVVHVRDRRKERAE